MRPKHSWRYSKIAPKRTCWRLNAAAQDQLKQVNAEMQQDAVPLPTLQDAAVSPSDVRKGTPAGDPLAHATISDRGAGGRAMETPNIETADGTDVVELIETAQGIDLASALGMAGGNAWTIQLARQKTVEAHADLQQAEALWLPTLQLGSRLE